MAAWHRWSLRFSLLASGHLGSKSHPGVVMRQLCSGRSDFTKVRGPDPAMHGVRIVHDILRELESGKAIP